MKHYILIFLFLAAGFSAVFASGQTEPLQPQFSREAEDSELSVTLEGILRVVGSDPFSEPVLVLNEESIVLTGGISMIGLIGDDVAKLLESAQSTTVSLSGMIIGPETYEAEYASRYPYKLPGVQGYFLVGITEDND